MSDSHHASIPQNVGDWIIVALLPLVLLTTSIRLEMNSPALYTRGFETYDVASATGIDEEQLDAIVTLLIDYFNSRAASPQMQATTNDGASFPLYHDYEIIHLADVKGLFDINSVLQSAGLLILVCLVSLALAHSRRRAVLHGLQRGAILTLGGLVVAGVLFATSFGDMFVSFHLLLFDNPFWQLDPRTDYLVKLFPYHFWQDMFMLAGGITATFSLVVLGIARFGLKRGPGDGPWQRSAGEP